MEVSAPGGFYCSEKFTWLSVDLEKRQWLSCCAVKPQNIDLKWVKNNTGQLFNLPALVQERTDMLHGRAVDSCKSTCWNPEKLGQVSRRMIFETQKQRFSHAHVQSPKNLNIMLGSNCNMTCVYCCKNYSSAWLRDISDHGSYMDNDRFRIHDRDRLLLEISQNEHKTSQGFKTLMSALSEITVQEKIYVSGGETMLFKNFVEMINNLTINNDVVIYTGMGVDKTRFKNQLLSLHRKDRVSMIISAENCDSFYEFNRFGNTWKNFMTNLEEIDKQEFSWHFSSVLSNLTVFGFIEFFKRFHGRHVKYEFCSEPEFLNANVLDKHSKDQLVESFATSNIPFQTSVIQAITAPVSESVRSNFSKYIREFARRRSLDLSIFPDSFVEWINDAQ
jgi:molybdenum cofactor biosynthesis enzyme MoaA